MAILRETTTLPRRRLSLRMRTAMSWPDQRIEIVDRTHIDLRSGHERGDADIDGETAFGAPGDAARDQQIFAMGPFERFPGMETRGFLVRQQQIFAGLRRSIALNNDVDDIVGLQGDGAVGELKLLDGNHALDLVADIDDHLFPGDLENSPLK